MVFNDFVVKKKNTIFSNRFNKMINIDTFINILQLSY